MKNLKSFNRYNKYNKIYESVSELVDQFDRDFIEEYFDEHLANDDFYDILEVYPQIIWNHIDDKSAMEDIMNDEINNMSVEEFDGDDIKKFINYKYLTEEEEKKIRQVYIDNEIDLDELEDLKVDYEDEDDEELKEELKEEIKEIEEKLKEINSMRTDEILDELSESELRDIIRDVFDEYEFIENIIKDRYDDYSLQDYLEEIYGSTDNITFNSYSRNGTGWDWILNYVDEDAVIEEYKDNESYEYKKERFEEEIKNSIDLQEKLLEIDKENALELFDVFNDKYSDDNISDTYDFQKAYIEEYAKNYANGDDDDLDEGKGEALKKLNDAFGLDWDIEQEYEDYMHYIEADKYNL